MYVVGYYLFSISKRYKTSQKKCIFRIVGRVNTYFFLTSFLVLKCKNWPKHTAIYFENSTIAAKKVPHQLLVCGIGDLRRTWMISLTIQFRIFRGPLFHKPVTILELVFAVSYKKPALVAVRQKLGINRKNVLLNF